VLTGQKVKEINNEIGRELGNQYKIDRFVRLEEIPKNTNGKTDKPGIKRDYLDGLR
jgi:hypothetical protein